MRMGVQESRTKRERGGNENGQPGGEKQSIADGMTRGRESDNEAASARGSLITNKL